MDMYETAKAIRQLTREKRYKDVVKIADRLNLDKVTSGLMILDIVEAYENQGDRKAARDALLAYYDSHGITGRNMMQKLIELCVETGDINNAVSLCLQFENSWPDSSISYLMRYQIAQASGESLETQISFLEKYRSVEFEERWGYELAKLYDRNNQREECAKLCHDLICFFGHGKYVEKAARLKSRVGGLTDDEERAIAEAYSKEAEEKQERENAILRAQEEAEAARKAAQERRALETVDGTEEAASDNRTDNVVLVSPEKGRDGRRGFSSAAFGTNADAWEADKARLRRDSYSSVFNPEYTAEEAKTPEPVKLNPVQEAQAEKLRQTEEAARRRKEQKEAELRAQEEMLTQAAERQDRYSQVEKYSETELRFSSIKRESGISAGEAINNRKNSAETGGFFKTVGKVASGIRKNFQSDEGDIDTIDSSDTEIEYITAGRESSTYLEDIENRILSELDMVDDEQLDSLAPNQIKELYELKMHRKLRDTIADLLKDCKTGTLPDADALDRFTEENPYVNELFEEIPDADFTEEDADEEPESIESEVGNPEENGDTKENDDAKENGDTTEDSDADSEQITVIGDPNFEEMAASDEESSAASQEDAADDIMTLLGKYSLEVDEAKEIADNSESDSEVEKVEAEGRTEDENQVGEGGSETGEGGSEAPEVVEEVVEPSILDDITDPDESLPTGQFRECVIAHAKRKHYLVDVNAYMTISVLAEQMKDAGTALSSNNAEKMASMAIERLEKSGPIGKIFGKYSKSYAITLRDRHFYWK